MPFQKPCGLWVNGQGNVWERVVHKHDLRVRAGYRFDRNAVVLLLVNQLDAVGHIGLRIAEVRCIIN